MQENSARGRRSRIRGLVFMQGALKNILDTMTYPNLLRGLWLLLLSMVLSSCSQFKIQGSIFDHQVANESPDGLVEPKPLYEVALTAGIPEFALKEAFEYFDQNQSKFRNQRYMGFIDFGLHSGEPRFFILNIQSGEVEALLTAHGKGSDMSNSGYAESFSNVSGSHMSSIGFYRGAERYHGKYGLSMRLDGLVASNSKARERAVVIHPANYVDANREKMGRSYGCPAVEYKWIKTVVESLEGGSLIYAFSSSPNQRIETRPLVFQDFGPEDL